MPKSTTKFVCQECGFESAKWLGRCTDCGAWNTMVETVIASRPSGSVSVGAAFASVAPISAPAVQSLAEERRVTGSPELDRTLGGGLVPGSLVLLGGEPGIGKCVTGDTRILDPESGDLLPITEYAHGAHTVLTLDETTYDLEKSRPTLFHDQGVKPIVEVRTRLGRTLRCTPSHPVLTPDGWRAVGVLTPGDRVAAPRALP
ncbi:MAG: hypothetical protein KGO05_01300, partial [Chloroflexota bacterium]|nr:hypothetical protein [Chloroflexota bacterium]